MPDNIQSKEIKQARNPTTSLSNNARNGNLSDDTTDTTTTTNTQVLKNQDDLHYSAASTSKNKPDLSPSTRETNEDEVDNHDEDEPEYIVEMLADKQVDQNGVAKYLVKWENYNRSENTWEPVENLAGCDWAMQNYQLTRANWLASKHNDDESLISRSPEPSTSKESSKSQSTIKKNSKPPKKGEKSTPSISRHELFVRLNMNGVSSKSKREWKVRDIVGLTQVDQEKYFLLALENYERKPFIRASLANKLFPEKVIDFYLKHYRWKRKPQPPSPQDSPRSSEYTDN